MTKPSERIKELVVEIWKPYEATGITPPEWAKQKALIMYLDEEYEKEQDRIIRSVQV